LRVAALYDIHGMLTPLEAVLDEVDDTDVIVVGGDVASGPQPSEALELLRGLGDRVRWVRGNGDRELATGGTGDYGPAVQRSLDWTAERLSAEQRSFLGSLAETVVLDVDGLGEVCFCHATPRSDEEIVTQATPDRHLRKILGRAKESVVVAGHTHMQLDRRVDGFRWVNAGSVGMPYEGEVAAFWALLGPDVELRRTQFDVERTVDDVLASGWPDAETFAEKNLSAAVRREDVVPVFEGFAIDRGER
jgi:predicted phosphodiesterase